MATKAAGTKTSARKTAGAKAAATKKAAPKKTASKKATAKTAGKRSAEGGDNYSRPELREKIKREVMAGDKGGRAGQWSARKAQLVAHEYEAEGGGYKHPRNAAQKSLKNWGDEHWHTRSGEPAIQGDETHRYLPDEAWEKLSAEQKDATDRKKVAGSRRGKQFVPNTGAAADARRSAIKHKG